MLSKLIIPRMFYEHTSIQKRGLVFWKWNILEDISVLRDIISRHSQLLNTLTVYHSSVWRGEDGQNWNKEFDSFWTEWSFLSLWIHICWYNTSWSGTWSLSLDFYQIWCHAHFFLRSLSVSQNCPMWNFLWDICSQKLSQKTLLLYKCNNLRICRM